jgi:hypothetical protein
VSLWPQDDDDTETRLLVERYRANEIEQLKMIDTQRRICEEVDAIRLTKRPTYPTEEQRAGLVEATRRIGEREVPASHHGDPTPTYAVVVDGRRGWLNIRHGAPVGARKVGSLWDFTDEDIEAFLEILKGEGHYWRILRWWRCDGGVSIEVTSS